MIGRGSSGRGSSGRGSSGRGSSGRGSWVVLLAVLGWMVAGPVAAHGLHPGVLSLTEQQPGVFAVQWTEPVDTSGGVTAVEVRFPEVCRHEGSRLDCTPEGLQGAIAFEGLEAQQGRVVAMVRWLDGRTTEALVTADAPRLELESAPGRSAGVWLGLGVEHILSGLDHLAFVVGLLLVVGVHAMRRLLATITAFTVAHSLTLGLATLGAISLPVAPVEATIAASVVLVAREATHEEATLTRRAPWAVALVFGLVHGLGFAGALGEWGVPERWVLPSLLWFNVGVELGQVAVVGVLVVGVWLLGRGVGRRRLGRLRPLATHAIGGLGAWWLIERTLAML